MKRLAENELKAWKDRTSRMPMVVRGARQVGKTFLVETFGKSHFPSFLTVNLEKKEELHLLFTRMEARHIVQELSLYFNQPIVPGQTLLFLDEIQACPKATMGIRWLLHTQVKERCESCLLCMKQAGLTGRGRHLTRDESMSSSGEAIASRPYLT